MLFARLNPKSGDSVHATSPTPVTLEDMLAAREQRAARQQALWGAFGQPLLSLTLVSPGPIKDSPALRFVFAEALDAIASLCAQRSWTILAQERVTKTSGPEAILVIDCAPQVLKEALIGLEDHHPLGRLWDMDVVCPGAVLALSRKHLNLPPRKCLVCDAPAHACARSRQHPLAAVLSVIEATILAYRNSRV